MISKEWGLFKIRKEKSVGIKARHFLVIISLGLIIALPYSGCGGGGSGGDSGVESAGTTTQVGTATTAALSASISVLQAIASSGSGLTVSDAENLRIIQADVTTTDSCAAGTLPSPSGTFSGTITGETAGSCSYAADQNDTTYTVLLDCIDFNNGDGAAMDGNIGLSSMGDQQSGTDTITSEDLTLTFDSDGTSCDVVLNMTVTRACNSATVSGCMNVCNSAFIISSTETLEDFCDETTPTISSLVDSNDNTISATASDNTTRLSALTTNTYTATFAEAMDTSTVITDNVSLICGTVQTITIAEGTDSDTIDNNTFVITPSAQLPDVVNCTLIFTANIKDAAGNALTETAYYTWPTKCASSDEFDNPDTLAECWLLDSNSRGTADIANGRLTFSSTTVDAYYTINKAVTGDFDVEIYISSSNHNEDDEQVFLSVGLSGSNNIFTFLSYTALNKFRSVLDIINDGYSAISSDIDTRTSTYFRVTRSGNLFTIYYKINYGDAWTELGSTTRADFDDTIYVSLGINPQNANGNFTAVFDYFRFASSGNVAGQD